MDVYILSPFNGDRPPPPTVQWIGSEESWIDAEVLGSTGRILDQDSFNVPRVRIGLRSAPAAGLPLSIYQESKVRHFHSVLDGWLGIETPGAAG